MPKPKPPNPNEPLGRVALLLGRIAVADEPTDCGLTMFADKGEAILTFFFAAGGPLDQVIIGLTPAMVATLHGRLAAVMPHAAQAIAAGNGGADFPAADKPEGTA